jgi:hypothetical protein
VGAVQVRARDQESKWLTALTLMDDDTYLAADNSSNMVSQVSPTLPWHLRIKHASSSVLLY